MLTQTMIRELKQLERAGDGILRTEAVVKLAKNPKSALHGHPAFEWDVKKAAFQQWLGAAREVVRVYVTVISDQNVKKEMRGYVSVRSTEEQAYRPTERVIQQDRQLLVEIVCDRILSAIRHYPLREFDAVVELVEQIKKGEFAGVA